MAWAVPLASRTVRRVQNHDGRASTRSTAPTGTAARPAKRTTPEEVSEEVHPGDSGSRAVDLSALDTYVEFKRRTGFPQPEREWVEQLDRFRRQGEPVLGDEIELDLPAALLGARPLDGTPAPPLLAAQAPPLGHEAGGLAV